MLSPLIIASISMGTNNNTLLSVFTVSVNQLDNLTFLVVETFFIFTVQCFELRSPASRSVKN